MDIAWELGECAIRDVWQRLCRDREVSFNAVMTVMNRLVERGLLERSGHRGAYIYRPVEDEATFRRHRSRAVIRGLVQQYGTAAVVGFVDEVAEADPAYLDELRRLVADRQAEPGEGESR